MRTQNETSRLGRRGKVFVTLAVITGTLSLLIYFEQIAIIYIGSTVALIALLLVVAFANLESIGASAAEEVYMTRRSEGILPGDRIGTVNEEGERAAPGGRRAVRQARREA